MHDSRIIAQANSPDMWSHLICQNQSQNSETMLLKWVITKGKKPQILKLKNFKIPPNFFKLEASTLIQLDCEEFNKPAANYQQMQGQEYTE
jgi:hypothetical protein